MQRAQTSRADIQRLGDRISDVFVPVVVVVALAAGLWWGLAPKSAAQVHDWLALISLAFAHCRPGTAAGFIIAAAVLIVACPCAMGLATPAAIMAGANAAARRGILIRDGIALEKAGKITAVIFDKTGTLTVGRPEVARRKEFGGQTSPGSKSWPRRWRGIQRIRSVRPWPKCRRRRIDLHTDWQEVRGCRGERSRNDAPAAADEPATLGSVR